MALQALERLIVATYAGVLCEIIKARDVQLEFESLGELAEAGADGNQFLHFHVRCALCKTLTGGHSKAKG